jgi:glycosyltransferase involved in cell wall biosynthesis
MRIISICQYIAHNPKHGGALRVFNINKELAKHKKVKVTQFSFTPLLFRNNVYITGAYTERISNPLIYTAAVVLLSRILRVQAYDFALPFTFNFVKPSKKLVDEIKKADLVVVEHPWLFRWAYKLRNKHNKKAKMVLDCHNSEHELFAALLNNKVLFRDKILDIVKKTEEFAVKNADLCLAMCLRDVSALAKTYLVNEKKFFIVPTGVALKDFKPLTAKEKNGLRQKLGLGLGGEKMVLFAGAKHLPNHEAYLQIKDKIAPETMKLNPKVLFVVAGSVCKKQSFENVVCTGLVDDILPYFQFADMAINPVLSGSGFNGKMIDYFAASLPVITTRHGARGLGVRDNKEVLIRETEDFPKTINNLLNNTELQLRLARGADRFVKGCEWKVIVSKLVEKYRNQY